LLLAAVQQSRDAAARVKCQNGLRQLALALHEYHNAQNTFPYGFRSEGNPDNMAYSGWGLSILPFIEQEALYASSTAAYAVSPSPFNNPPHSALCSVVKTFLCPSDPRVFRAQVSERTHELVAFTSFLGISGRNYQTKDGVLFQDSIVNILSITDGTSNTLLLGERPPSADFQFGWWYAGIGQLSTGSADMVMGVNEINALPVTPSSCAPGAYPFMPGKLTNQCDMFHYWSPHPGGANFAFADGSVRFLSYSANPILPALASRAGGEAVTDPY
jgi:prepilin-type processing-associated H-X9-DG protein